VALTNEAGQVVDRYTYDVWGAPTSATESVPQPFRYAGYWWDKELGWYWVSVRSYDPVLKRWVQPDPSEHDGIRTYVYVGNDPEDRTDPTGLDGGAIAVGAGTVCVGSIPIPFFGEVDCAVAVAILGVVAVSNIIHQLFPVRSTPITQAPAVPRSMPRYTPMPRRRLRRRRVPIFYVYETVTPEIARHDYDAIVRQHKPFELQYIRISRSVKRQVRRAAGCNGSFLPSKAGDSCDEYPFASTSQGGTGASIASVPADEQNKQGQDLSIFYSTIQPGDWFLVVVVLNDGRTSLHTTL